MNMNLRCQILIAFSALVFSPAVCGCGNESQNKVKDQQQASVPSQDKVDQAVPETAGQSQQQASWGTLRGRFVYDGEAPQRNKIDISANPEYCGRHGLEEEKLVVDDDGGIADVMIWVRSKDVPVHEDYLESASEPVELNNKNCRFFPHVVAMQPGQQLRVTNSDPVSHNTEIRFALNTPFNEQLSPGATKEINVAKPETRPVEIKCGVHPWMSSYVLVKETPYAAVTGEDGSFEIKNLPAGVELEFQVFHPLAERITSVSKENTPTEWRRGRFKMSLAEGDNDLKNLVVGPDQFSKRL
ncbi:MAG: hypothetical protein N2C12_16280 [Planctomycetales bacterium]